MRIFAFLLITVSGAAQGFAAGKPLVRMTLETRHQKGTEQGEPTGGQYVRIYEVSGRDYYPRSYYEPYLEYLAEACPLI